MIRRLLPSDADAVLRIRREALEREPFAFSSSPAEDRMLVSGALEEYLAVPGRAMFGALEPTLVGMAGIIREDSAKSRHKARLWGVYVTAEWRGQGIGRGLVEAAIDFAQSLDGLTQVHLAVAEPGRAAQELYRHLGFTIWGTEPAALRVGDVSVAELHMVRVLRPGAG